MAERKKRGGKRYGTKIVTPGGGSTKPAYPIEIVEVQIMYGGKRRSTSYSINRHGVKKANQLADAWLTKHRALAAATS